MTVTDEDRRDAAAALEEFKRAGGTVRTGADAKRPARTVETAAAEFDRMREAIAEAEASGIRDGEHSAGAPVPDDGTKRDTTEAAPGPDELEHDQAGEDQAEAPAPTPKARPVPEPTGEGLPVPLWGDLTMKVYPEVKGACPVEFVTAARGRIYIDNPKSPPWLSTRIQDRLVVGLTAALGEDQALNPKFMRRRIGEAFAEISKQLETDEGTRKALTPAAVRRVIEETERVTIYPAADGGIYEIVISGKVLILTSAQMARKTPDGDAGFNHHWLILFPTDEIDATKNEWKAIKAHWYEIAEVREAEETTEAETVIDRLVEDLERVTLVRTAAEMLGHEYAWHDEKKGVIWVHGRRLARFLEDLKRPGWNNGKLSTELQRAGYTFGNTKPQRIGLEAKKGGKQIKCWGFKPGLIEFRPPAEESTEVRDFVAP